MAKFGRTSRIGWPVPSIGDITGCAARWKTTCCEPSMLTSLCRRRGASPTPVCRATSFSEKYAAAMTAVILMKNWTMSMTSTPQRPECAAKTTLSTPQMRMVCQRRQAEEDVGDLARRQRHHPHDEAVEEEAEIDRAEAADDDAALPE